MRKVVRPSPDDLAPDDDQHALSGWWLPRQTAKVLKTGWPDMLQLVQGRGHTISSPSIPPSPRLSSTPWRAYTTLVPDLVEIVSPHAV